MKNRNTTPSRFRNYNPHFQFRISSDNIIGLQQLLVNPFWISVEESGFPLSTMVTKKLITQEQIDDFFKLSTSARVVIWNNRNLSNSQLTKFQDCLSYYIAKIDISQLKKKPFTFTGPNDSWIVCEDDGIIFIYNDPAPN
jgi:hypothetical protein